MRQNPQKSAEMASLALSAQFGPKSAQNPRRWSALESPGRSDSSVRNRNSLCYRVRLLRKDAICVFSSRGAHFLSARTLKTSEFLDPDSGPIFDPFLHKCEKRRKRGKTRRKAQKWHISHFLRNLVRNRPRIHVDGRRASRAACPRRKTMLHGALAEG